MPFFFFFLAKKNNDQAQSQEVIYTPDGRNCKVK